MSVRTETFEARNTVVEIDDGGDTDLSIIVSASTGTDFEISGTMAEITRFATDLVAALILKGDCG
jgi:hypothetical protein